MIEKRPLGNSGIEIAPSQARIVCSKRAAAQSEAESLGYDTSLQLLIGFMVSAAIAVSSSIEVLLLLRFVQGLAGAAGMVLSQAMVRDLYSGSRMATFISRLFLVGGVALVVASSIAGACVDSLLCRSVHRRLGRHGLHHALAYGIPVVDGAGTQSVHLQQSFAFRHRTQSFSVTT